MKIIAQYETVSYTRDGQALLTLKIPSIQHSNMIGDIEKGCDLSVEITKAKSKRSIEQNRLMWALLSDIDKAVNGERSNDAWSMYVQALERAGAKSYVIVAPVEFEDSIRRSYRAYKYLCPFESEKGVECGYYEVYEGSSKMNTKEMTLLIETVLDMAAECGVDTVYWKGVLM